MGNARFFFVCLLVSLLSFSTHAEVPLLINYQGRLVDGTNLVNGDVVMTISLKPTGGGGPTLFADTGTVTVVDGLYSTYIGDGRVPAFGTLSEALTNSEVWILVDVDGTLLTPSEQLVSVGFAQVAASVTNNAITREKIAPEAVGGNEIAGGAVAGYQLAGSSVISSHIQDGTVTVDDVGTNVFWRTDGNTGTTPGTHILGTTDDEDLVIQARLVGINTNDPQRTLHVAGDMRVDDTLFVGAGQTTSVNQIYFGDATETLSYDPSNKAFRFSDDLRIAGAFKSGGIGTTTQPYNCFGILPDPLSGDMGNAADVFITGDLEVDETAYLNGTLYMKGTTNSGNDGSQTIYFYDSDLRTGQYIRWDDVFGYFFISDNLAVVGDLTKSSGSFKIDHPLDPANKYLYHSFVESPDMKNIYDGVAVLDEQGEASITLPDWFGALNKDFRYQLTPVGQAAPGLFIGSEIEQNQFMIAGGPPGLKVSWQVTGIRQDAWANAHRIPTEVDKDGNEKDLYIHPELFGQPPEKAVGR